MLYPLTVAIYIVTAIAFTAYVFRLALAKWAGKVHRQMQEDKLEIRREYHHGFGRNED